MSYKTLKSAREKTLYFSTDEAGYLRLEVLRPVPRVASPLRPMKWVNRWRSDLRRICPRCSEWPPQGKELDVDLEVRVRAIRERMQQLQRE